MSHVYFIKIQMALELQSVFLRALEFIAYCKVRIHTLVTYTDHM